MAPPFLPDAAPLLSVVSPVYRGAAMLDELVQRLLAAVRELPGSCEIILVDDRSPDNAWAKIEELSQQHTEVRGVRLSRNFGQHRAIAAGLDHCRGQWVVVLDCDLQDRPEEIPRLWGHAQQHGLDYVLASRQDRQHGLGQRLVSGAFYRVLRYLTGVPHDASVANFGLYQRRVIEAVQHMPERARFFPVMVRWVGFQGATLPVAHAARSNGGSSYSWGRRLQLAFDVMLAWSDKPLRLAVQFGLLVTGLAFLLGLITLVRFWVGQISVPGYTSLVLLLCFFAGLIISLVGMVGLYVGRTFEEAKQRPVYLVDATTNRPDSVAP
ncbi:glycosyltransferase family 2 protein [Hymenobacter busanensis]|uniref:Glycosyltransferase family 2 protein n=1 Tax=Hymenobacter busanensis TaxID=2607656 RepID=A0A7L4ZV94_9BACT|nr:glycosyltransferase family 2 protein [Hymenobacter busanensis]KAA9332274.1 glycosyltransferase family 2 protein [Hymenobacter busanensis]QHJ07389.1 glycosyltransferase [Hymenobacter busanensis]